MREDAYFAGKLVYLAMAKSIDALFYETRGKCLDTSMFTRVGIQYEQSPTNNAPSYVCVFMIYQPRKEMFSF